MRRGARSGGLVLLAAMAASAVAHALAFRLSAPNMLTIAPGSHRCRVGETLMVDARLGRGRARAKAGANIRWESHGQGLEVLGQGVFRCSEEGRAEIVAVHRSLRATAAIEVGPALVAVEASPHVPPPEAPKPARARPTAPPRPRPRAHDPVPAPEPARAGAALTTTAPTDVPAIPSVEGASESYGSGVVASTGAAAVAAENARAGGIARGTGTGEPARARPPSLTTSDPCRGQFPDQAETDRALVEVDIDADPEGRVREARILAEDPPGQGFGIAARRCLRAVTLTPALDERGAACAGRLRIRLRFER